MVQLLSSQNRARDMERRLRESEEMVQRLRTENDALKKATAEAAAAAAGDEVEAPIANGAASRPLLVCLSCAFCMISRVFTRPCCPLG